jgi:hypothetical protein
MSRWTLFLIVLMLGFGLGLLYGWVINPVQYQDTDIESLRIDYQTDFVLMISEVFHNEENPEWAFNRLTILGYNPPLAGVEEALKFATQAEYTLPDMFLMRDLYNGLKDTD